MVKGKTAEHDVQILLDTGASKSCISTTACNRGKWTIWPGQLEVTAFDGSQQRSPGCVMEDIAMGEYQESVKLSIVAMPNFDVVLGEDWLARHAASLYYKGTFVAKFEHQGKEYNIPAVMPSMQQKEQQILQQIDAFDALDKTIPEN